MVFLSKVRNSKVRIVRKDSASSLLLLQVSEAGAHLSGELWLSSERFCWHGREMQRVTGAKNVTRTYIPLLYGQDAEKGVEPKPEIRNSP